MPRIPEGIIEQIAAANDIVDVVGSYFPLKRAGGMFKALCPFHQERTPSFSVNPQRQIFKCFGCGAGGSVFRFVMDYEKVSFIEAVRKLAEKANIRIPEAELTADELQRSDMRRRLLAMHAEAADFFHTCLMRTAAGAQAREYFKKRGLGAEVAKSWKLGFAPDSWDALLVHLQQEGYTGEELAGSGLFARQEESTRIYDRFRGRVMFPICNDTGEVIAFSGRVLDAEQRGAKYVNSAETILFTKGAVLFGLHKTKRAMHDKKQAIVCEGQIDLITAFENGVQNVIAPQGTAFTERQARILKRHAEEVVLCFDSDAAGEKAAEKSLPYLLGTGLLVRCAEMPPGEDPDSLIRSRGGPAFAGIIAQSKDFFEFQLEREARKPDFATPRGKVLAARKLAEFISLIPEAVVREAVLNNAAIRLEIPADQLRAMLKKPQEFKHGDEDSALDATPLEPTTLDAAQKWLAFLALREPDVRKWLLAQPWRNTLADGAPGSVLLMKIFAAEFRPGDVASVNAWLTTLPREDETAVSSVLELEMPRDPQVLAEDCWNALKGRDLLRRRQAAEARLRAAGLAFEEQARLHQEILELQQQLAALPAPRPPKADT